MYSQLTFGVAYVWFTSVFIHTRTVHVVLIEQHGHPKRRYCSRMAGNTGIKQPAVQAQNIVEPQLVQPGTVVKIKMGKYVSVKVWNAVFVGKLGDEEAKWRR